MTLAVISALCQGAAVGIAGTAVMTNFVIVPRILQVFGIARDKTHLFAAAVSFGVIAAAVIDALKIRFALGTAGTAIAGLFCGVHAGLLAMAAVEVLNIVPFLSAGSAFKGMLKYFLAAVVAGKSVGALAYFLDGRWMI